MADGLCAGEIFKAFKMMNAVDIRKWMTSWKCWCLFVIICLPVSGFTQTKKKPLRTAGVTLSFPWVNSYRFYNYYTQEAASNTGFVGLGGSAYYKPGKNKFSLNGCFTGDLPVPIGPFDYGKTGTRSNIKAFTWEALYHRSIYKHLYTIVGLNYVRYQFDFTSYVDSLPSFSRFDKTFGVTAGIEYYFTERFSAALFYRPAIVSLDTKQYRHLISLDARIDVNFWRRK